MRERWTATSSGTFLTCAMRTTRPLTRSAANCRPAVCARYSTTQPDASTRPGTCCAKIVSRCGARCESDGRFAGPGCSKRQWYCRFSIVALYQVHCFSKMFEEPWRKIDVLVHTSCILSGNMKARALARMNAGQQTRDAIHDALIACVEASVRVVQGRNVRHQSVARKPVLKSLCLLERLGKQFCSKHERREIRTGFCQQ